MILFKEAYGLVFLKDISQFERLQQVCNISCKFVFSFCDITSNHQSRLGNCLRIQVFHVFLGFVSIQHNSPMLTKRIQFEL